MHLRLSIKAGQDDTYAMQYASHAKYARNRESNLLAGYEITAQKL